MPPKVILLKHLLIILALAGILLQTFSKGIIWVNFELNRDYIAKNICVKKDKIDNCCKGSCELKKQLSEDDSKERSAPVNTLKDKSEVSFFTEAFSGADLLFPTSSVALGNPYLIPSTHSISFSVFHPPQA